MKKNRYRSIQTDTSIAKYNDFEYFTYKECMITSYLTYLEDKFQFFTYFFIMLEL